jgi:hypothetical protein
MKLETAIDIWKHSDTYKKQSSIHWLIWLLENPSSPISLTGAINLYNHDIIHILLDRGMEVKDEAMVIGFTMGNTGNTNKWIKKLFKFCARWIYPKGYKFDEHDLLEFERGFVYGYTRPIKNIHLYEFDKNEEIEDIRKIFGIELINTK